MIVQRDDDTWIIDLTSEDLTARSEAASDLRDMLIRGLAKSLSKQGRVDNAFLEDAVQEATIKILESIASFEGRSKFRTWAVTIAVRTAFARMRQRDWHSVSLECMVSNSEFDPQAIEQANDRITNQSEMLGRLRELISSELTERQWVAITAELDGMPPPQIAEKLQCSTNSIYKLMHDARKKLRSALEAAGYTIDELCEAWA